MSDLGPATHPPGAAIALRPIGPDDRPLLLAIYASTRAQELAMLPWDDEQKAAFTRMQFEAQHAQFQEFYADASFDVIVLDGHAAGRLYVKRADREIRIVDIALLPEYCNKGIGTSILSALQAEATRTGKPLRIHVERFNPALRLYSRLGFREIADRGVYLFMEWLPPAGVAGGEHAAAASAALND